MGAALSSMGMRVPSGRWRTVWLARPMMAPRSRTLRTGFSTGLPVVSLKMGKTVGDGFASGEREGDAHEGFGHGVEEGDAAVGVGGDDGVAEAGEGGAEPGLALFELAGVDVAEGHGFEDVIAEEAEAEDGDEGGEIDGDVGVADAAASGVGVGGDEGGFLQLNLVDEVVDPDHEDAAAVGEDLLAGGLGVAGLVEEDGVGELGELGLDEGAELGELSLLGGVAVGHVAEEI